MRLGGLIPKAKGKSFHRFLATDRQALVNNAASKLKYEVTFGAHCRAPHDKNGCEDAFFIWSGNGVAAFGRLADSITDRCVQFCLQLFEYLILLCEFCNL